MKKSLFVLIGACAVLLAACGVQLTSAERASIEKEANITITCKEGRDCERKWSRAGQWVAESSAYKVRVSSDNLIQTSGPARSSTNSAFTVTKYATGQDMYVIKFDSYCDNWFGCEPTATELKAVFTHFVLNDHPQ